MWQQQSLRELDTLDIFFFIILQALAFSSLLLARNLLKTNILSQFNLPLSNPLLSWLPLVLLSAGSSVEKKWVGSVKAHRWSFASCYARTRWTVFTLVGVVNSSPNFWGMVSCVSVVWLSLHRSENIQDVVIDSGQVFVLSRRFCGTLGWSFAFGNYGIQLVFLDDNSNCRYSSVFLVAEVKDGIQWALGCLSVNYGRFAPSPFRPKSFRPNSKLFRPDQNKTSTVETLFTQQEKAVGGLLSSANDRWADFVWLYCHASATALPLIYEHNHTNTFRLNGSLTTQMFNKRF